MELPRFGGHLIIGHSVLVRGCSRVPHPPGLPSGLQAEAVRLVGSSDKSVGVLAKALGVADQTLRNWVRQAEIDGGARDGLTQGEREELRRLRREVRTLTEEREILRKAAAFFAKDSETRR